MIRRCWVLSLFMEGLRGDGGEVFAEGRGGTDVMAGVQELVAVRSLEQRLDRNWRGLASAITALLLLSSAVAAHRMIGVDDERTNVLGGDRDGGQNVAAGPDANLGATVTTGVDAQADGAAGPTGAAAAAGAVVTPGGAPTGGPGGTIPPGVTDTEIEVIYYWTDRTRDSPYRPDNGQANLDEGQAFHAFIEWMNKHSGDGSKVMGYPFNLHGRKLVPKVIELSKAPEDRARVAEDIAVQHKPFATLASHGSISTYMCDRIAKGGVHNLSTYDFGGNLKGRTNGYCLPLGMSWELQVERTVSYLAWHQKNTRYETSPGVTEPRVYGILYAAYPNLDRSVEGQGGVVERLRGTGVNVGHVAAINPDLGISQAQVPNVVAQFRRAGVNTVVMPDAGAPLNFTNGAQANGYSPDYFVWPCSGQDTIGMVRLFNPTQWARASGLTCYDDHFNPDLVNDDNARATEWYRVWTEMRGTSRDAPSSASLIWFNLLPLVAGITESGRNLTVEGFRAGLARLPNYRYDAISGRTDNPINFLQTLSRADQSPIGDVAKLYWSPSRTRSGSATQGSYVYPENRRYREGEAF